MYIYAYTSSSQNEIRGKLMEILIFSINNNNHMRNIVKNMA